jgi:hypothetical protein
MERLPACCANPKKMASISPHQVKTKPATESTVFATQQKLASVNAEKQSEN